MNKEELKKEAEEWLNKWELCNKCENKVDCISSFSYCKKVVLQAYLASAEPREKRIAELEVTNKHISDEYHKLVDSLEKKQNENELLETQNIKLQAEVSRLTIKNAELKEKLKPENCLKLLAKEGYVKFTCENGNEHDQLTKAKEIISEWEDSFCCGTDYLYLGNKGKELRSKSQKFLNSEVVK